MVTESSESKGGAGDVTSADGLDAESAASGPSLSPAAAAHRLGVAVGTLRSWDRRYGIGPRGHSSGAHRRYSPADLAMLEEMCRMVAEGVPVAEAARTVQDGIGAPALARLAESGADAAGDVSGGGARNAAGDAAGDVAGGGTGRADGGGSSGGGLGGGLGNGSSFAGPSVGVSTAARLPAGPSAGLPTGRSGGLPVGRSVGHPGGGSLPIGRGANSARGLARAAVRLDTPQVLAQLEACLARDGVISAWEDTITPALAAVGRKWTETDGRYVEVEHLMSWCVSVALHRVLAAPPRARRVPDRGVALACAPDEWHSLPLDVLTAALGEIGVPVRMFGAAVPARALLEAVNRVQPRAVLVWSQTSRTANPALLAALANLPGTKVMAAGPGWHGRLPESVMFVESLERAVSICAD